MSEEVNLVDLIRRSSSPRQRRSRKKSWLRILKPLYLLYILVPLIVIGAIWGIAVADSLSRVTRSQDDLTILLNSLENKTATDYTLDDYEQLDIALENLNDALKTTNSRTQPFQTVSFVNNGLETRLKLLDIAIHVTSGARYLLAGLKPTVVFMERGDTNENANSASGITFTSARLVELTTSGGNRFLLAKAELDSAKALLAELNLDSVSTDDILDIENLQDYIDQIDTYNDLALEAPELLNVILGIDRPQTYLVLSENNDEIRPSGGYISTWGWISVNNGRVEDYNYFPTTLETPTPPPKSLEDTYPVPEWWINYETPIYAAWDGSWYADFGKTAQMAAWFYDSGGNLNAPVDGVFGIDLTAFEYLVGALGEVEVPEYGTSVTADTFRDTIYTIRAARETPEAHKQFLAVLYGHVIDDWRKADTETKNRINRAFLQAFREKHLMVYFVDERSQRAATQLDWTGAQTLEPFQDYLMMADANLGNKSSGSVQRQLTLDVTIDSDRTVNSHLGIFYNFPATLAEADPAVRPEHYGDQKDYYSILQVFTPNTSQPVEGDSSSALRLVPQEDFNIFTKVVTVLYDNSMSISLDYASSGLIEPIGNYYRYRLRLAKQPGATDDVATVSISIPTNATEVFVSPDPDSVYDLGHTVLEFNFNLTTDQLIEVIYQEAQ